MTKSHLAACNEVPVYSVEEEEFRTYGRVVEGYDFSGLVSYLKSRTSIPEKGNLYVPSVPEMEADAVKRQLQETIYGGMPIQIGYCNGRNQSYNGFEYHKCSEINVAATDFMLVLGHVWEMKENTYHTDAAKVFFVREGTAIELYQTTLHLSPCRVTDEGYRTVVILAEGTNTPLQEHFKPNNANGESCILLKKNKWVIAHPDWKPLREQGAYPGLQGENICLRY
ncbi:MAG: DUF4867 family protein [Clostridiales bacterium]|nr:DUF4867 family protein [Roseburia sp.]MDD7635790.1 DUF4867 family protein [Clostridiales bacterium]MDY4112121.1 DUF4867 family protein [Roseburia sp.]